MKYTAEITERDILEGLLRVQVRFTSEDGTKIVQDYYETRSLQDRDWLKNNIRRKKRELEELDSFVEAIPVKVLTDADLDIIVPDPAALTPKEKYAKKLEKFNKMVSVLRQGFILPDNAEFLALQQKLKDDFDPNYLDLF